MAFVTGKWQVSRRPIVYIMLGFVGVAFSAFIISRASRTGHPTLRRDEWIPVLRAMEDIGYGQKIVLAAKEGEGDVKPNAKFVEWPKSLAPEAVVGDEKAFRKKEMIARDDLYKGGLILEPDVTSQEEFLPEDMLVRDFKVEPNDIVTGKYSAGKSVDIRRRTPEGYQDFIRCVPIYGVGDLGEDGLPKEAEGDPKVMVLITGEHLPAYEKAVAEKMPLKIFPAGGPCAEGAVLVEQGETDELPAHALAALQAQEALSDSVGEARRHAEAGELDKALGALQGVEVVKLALDYRSQTVKRLCDRAEQARQADDLAAALAALDELDRADVVIARARTLRAEIESARAAQAGEHAYSDLVTGIEGALEAGNLPLAEQELAKLAPYIESRYEPQGDLPAPAQAQKDFADRLRKSKKDYEVQTQLLKIFLGQGRCADARKKLEQIKERFGAHPDLKEWQQKVADCEGGD